MCCLKCLSAFGFWGTDNKLHGLHGWETKVSNAFRLLGSGEHTLKATESNLRSPRSQMPFGFWVLGNHSTTTTISSTAQSRLKCLSAFGFWGTTRIYKTPHPPPPRLKCLSAFGFWGTEVRIAELVFESGVSNAFRLLGSGEPETGRETVRRVYQSQMPFGFWVLGNLLKHPIPFNQ